MREHYHLAPNLAPKLDGRDNTRRDAADGRSPETRIIVELHGTGPYGADGSRRLRKPFYLATITLASIRIWLRDDESMT